MKRLKLLYFLLASIGVFISCNKESYNKDVSNEIYNSNIHLRNQTPYFQDTTGWEQWYVFNLMKGMPDDELLNFLKHQGYPDWDNYVRKTGSQLNITSIPIMYGDSLNGVIRVYVTDEDTIRVNYFSKAMVDDAISRELNTEEYHLIRGAVQSIMSLTCQIHGVSNEVYQNWLLSQRNRIQERTIWHCIEVWDCYWDYPCWNGGSGGGGVEEICDLVYRECWKDFPNFNFPNGNNGTGGNNNSGNGTNTGGNNSGGSGSESQAIKNAKIAFLNNWLNNNGLSSDYFYLLYHCVGYLPSPFGGSADEFIDNNCAFENLANVMEECLQFDFVGCDEIPNGICPETFNFKDIGNGFTCEVNSISFKFFGVENFTKHIGTLCIQTAKYDVSGNLLTKFDASELMTGAWEDAQFLTGVEFAASNHTLSNQQYKNLFIENLRIGMSSRFQNNGNSFSVSSGPCSGGIPRSRPKYSIFC